MFKISLKSPYSPKYPLKHQNTTETSKMVTIPLKPPKKTLGNI